MGDSINIREYILIFKRRKWIVIIIMMVCILAGAGMTYLNHKNYVPMYQTSTRIRINSGKNNPDGGFSPQYTALNQNIANSYGHLATSKNALNEIVSTLGIGESGDILKGSIVVTPQESNAEFIDVSVTYSDANIAQSIADLVPTAFNNELKRVVNLDCIEVVDKPIKPTYPINSASNKPLKIGIAGGIIVSIFIVLLLECLNSKITTPEDVENYWGLPVIGVVPYDNYKKKRCKREKGKKTKQSVEVN